MAVIDEEDLVPRNQPKKLKDLTLMCGELRESFAIADRVLAPRLPLPLSQYVYPPPPCTGSTLTFD